MRRLFLALTLFLASLGGAGAQQLVPATTNSTSITGTVAASTKIISGVSGRYIYITALYLVPVATSVVTLTTGTGTNCGTNTTNLTGAMTFAASQLIEAGNGYGALIAVPVGQDVCITIATAVAPGWIAWALF